MTCRLMAQLWNFQSSEMLGSQSRLDTFMPGKLKEDTGRQLTARKGTEREEGAEEGLVNRYS